MTTTMFAKHKVNDYENWKRAYDSFASVRKENSVSGASVHRDINDPSIVIVTHQFKTTDAALAFVDSEELKWHQDLKDRKVTILEDGGWQFQMDDELPVKLSSAKQIYIPKFVWHRVIKGSSKLVVEIEELD